MTQELLALAVESFHTLLDHGSVILKHRHVLSQSLAMILAHFSSNENNIGASSCLMIAPNTILGVLGLFAIPINEKVPPFHPTIARIQGRLG
jgi:hypothetical protein